MVEHTQQKNKPDSAGKIAGAVFVLLILLAGFALVVGDVVSVDYKAWGLFVLLLISSMSMLTFLVKYHAFQLTSHQAEDELAELLKQSNEQQTLMQASHVAQQNMMVVVQRNQTRMGAILDNADSGILTISSHGLIDMFNAAAEKLFGYGRGEVIGENVKMLMPDCFAMRHDACLEEFRKSEQKRDVAKGGLEVVGKRKDGSEFPLFLNIGTMNVDGAVSYIAMLRDVTTQKNDEAKLQQQHDALLLANDELERKSQALQHSKEELKITNTALVNYTEDLKQQKTVVEEKSYELELASQYKSEFLANMSHELRTPLNSILVLSDMLSRNRAKNLTEKQINNAKLVHKSGKDLLTLIDDILDLSKVEAGKMKLVLNPVNVNELCMLMVEIFEPMVAQKSIDFIFENHLDIRTKIETDTQRILQILKNLISNAIKFTQQGSVTLKVEKSISNAANELIFSVIDTGIGIPEEKQQSIFQSFRQADGSTSREYGGTGLGLTISRKLSVLLGAEIRLQSEEGNGSTFQLVFPWLPVSEQDDVKE
jgi:PAS domain S-box-containing protein